jgi:hypothetical protein
MRLQITTVAGKRQCNAQQSLGPGRSFEPLLLLAQLLTQFGSFLQTHLTRGGRRFLWLQPERLTQNITPSLPVLLDQHGLGILQSP